MHVRPPLGEATGTPGAQTPSPLRRVKWLRSCFTVYSCTVRYRISSILVQLSRLSTTGIIVLLIIVLLYSCRKFLVAVLYQHFSFAKLPRDNSLLFRVLKCAGRF